MIDSEKRIEQLTRQLEELRVENDSLKLHFAKSDKMKTVIKGHKQAEEQLAISELRYRRLFESAKDGILILDADSGMITDVNPFLIELLGYSEEQFTEKAIWEIGFFKDIVANKDKFAELQQNEYIRYEDLPLETAHGRKINVEFVSNVYFVNHIKVIQCNIRDITKRKRLESERRKVVDRLSLACRTSGIGIWEYDIVSDTLIWDDQMCKLYGITPDTFGASYESWRAGIHPDDLERWEAELQLAIQGKKEFDMEFRVVWPDGSVHTVRALALVQRDSSGAALDMVGTHYDITKRRQAEEDIHRMNVFLDSIVDNIPDMIFLKDAEELRFMQFNRAGEELLGIPREELLGKNDYDFFSKELADYFIATDKEVLRNGQLLDIPEEPIQTAHHGIRILHTKKVPILNAHGVPTYLLGISEDITERKLALDAQYRHSERLKVLHQIDQSILQAIDPPEVIAQRALRHLSALLMCQTAGIGILVQETREMRIFAADTDVIGTPQGTTIPTADFQDDLDVLQIGIMDVVEDTISLAASNSLLAKALHDTDTGSYINIPLISAHGFYGVLYIGWNVPRTITADERAVTEEMASQITVAIEQARLWQEAKRHTLQLEERVKERTIQLETVNKELESFSYSVSHDLRAPIRGILGFTSILMEDHAVSLNDEGKRVCSVIEANAKKMERLISDLLAFAHIGRVELTHAVIDMKALALSVYKELCDSQSLDRIDFSTDELCTTTGEPSLLRQVWTNLLSNAIKYSSKTERAVISVSCKDEDGKCIFCVRDNGVGFDMKHEKKLFGVFERLHSAKDYEGTGVGLAIVQRIIHRHGGEVWAEGEVGKGAAFFFSLPNT